MNSPALTPEDPTQRFSNRVANYDQYRPGYPEEIVTLLIEACGLNGSSKVADIGSGTGLLTELFLRNKNPVWAVEPNDEMRDAAERHFAGQLLFTSVAATAEKTTLVDNSMDFVTIAQALHWFDLDKAGREFQRILKDGGWLVLIWNHRLNSASAFLLGYENMLIKHCPEYAARAHRDHQKTVKTMFGEKKISLTTLANRQFFDFESLLGRLLSSSYSLTEADQDYNSMVEDLRLLHKKHAVVGKVTFEYETRIFTGHLRP